MKSKTNTDEVDEDFLLSTFRDKEITPAKGKESEPEVNSKPQAVSSSGDSKTSSRRKKGGISYKDSFFKRNEFKDRRSVYISSKNHGIISQIIRMLGDSDLSVGGYIDLILTEHLEQNKEEIMDVFRKWKEKQTNDLSDHI